MFLRTIFPIWVILWGYGDYFHDVHGNRRLDSPEVVGISSESDLQLLEEFVHACEQRLRRACFGGDGGGALEHDDAVGEVGRHNEVVLNDEAGLLGVQDETLDHLGETMSDNYENMIV